VFARSVRKIDPCFLVRSKSNSDKQRFGRRKKRDTPSTHPSPVDDSLTRPVVVKRDRRDGAVVMKLLGFYIKRREKRTDFNVSIIERPLLRPLSSNNIDKLPYYVDVIANWKH